MEKINKYRNLIVEIIWIYFSLIPTLIIIVLSFIELHMNLYDFINMNKIVLMILFLLLFSLFILDLYIKMKIKNNNIMMVVGNIKKISNNKEYMAFNFFAIYLLPIVSINTKNLPALIMVIILLTLISYKAELFYYNIFLFLFYKYEQVSISGTKYFIIARRGSPSIMAHEKLFLIDDKIKLFIRYDEQ